MLPSAGFSGASQRTRDGVARAQGSNYAVPSGWERRAALCCVYEPLETTTTRGLASFTGLDWLRGSVLAQTEARHCCDRSWLFVAGLVFLVTETLVHDLSWVVASTPIVHSVATEAFFR